MPSGDAVVYLAIVLAVAGIATSVLRLRTRDARLVRVSGLLSIGLFLLVTGLTLFMYYLFIVADVD
jgi:cytochrome c biogenesis factor